MHIYLLQIALLDLYSLGGDTLRMKIKLNSGYEAKHFQLYGKYIQIQPFFLKLCLKPLSVRNCSFILLHHLKICPIVLPTCVYHKGRGQNVFLNL